MSSLFYKHREQRLVEQLLHVNVSDTTLLTPSYACCSILCSGLPEQKHSLTRHCCAVLRKSICLARGAKVKNVWVSLKSFSVFLLVRDKGWRQSRLFKILYCKGDCSLSCNDLVRLTGKASVW